MKRIPAGWSEIPEDEYETIWSRFEERYAFRPDYYPSGWPAIDEPTPSVTYDLGAVAPGAAWSEMFDRLAVEASDAFRSAFASELDLVVLDWQHLAYRIDHHVASPVTEQIADEFWIPSVYPNGDYYAFMTADTSEGTFGHPWEKTLCVIGPRLGAVLVPMLDTWLPRKRVNGRAR